MSRLGCFRLVLRRPLLGGLLLGVEAFECGFLLIERDLREEVTTALSYHLLREPARSEALIAEMPEGKSRRLGIVWVLGKTRRELGVLGRAHDIPLYTLAPAKAG